MKISFELNEKCGIYKIFNKNNNKFYIGSSKNIYDRLHLHFFKLKNQRHGNKHLQSSYNKYNKESFDYEILEFCNKEEQFIREQYYISLLKPEYNKSLNVIANFGISPSKDTRLKISETLKRKYKSGEIKTYKQEHLWRNLYIYDIYDFKLIKICKNIKNCCDFLNIGGVINIHKRIINNKFVILENQFINKDDLKNYIYKNYFIKNSKYLIVKENDTIYYFLTINSLCEFIKMNRKRFYKEKKINFIFNFNNYTIYNTENYIKLPS